MLNQRHLSPAIGSVITGVDVRKMDRAMFDTFASAFHDRGMLVFRGQFLDAAELEAFAERWGRPWNGPILAPAPGARFAFALGNYGKDKTITEYWHYDSTYVTAPPAITMLSAQDVPETGGDTMWCNQYRIYEELSSGLKELLGRLKAVHYGRNQAKLVLGNETNLISTAHPIVRTHPVTKRKALFISGQAEHFENMTRAESEPLLRYLLSLLGRPDVSCRHHWEKGDLVMWDNRCTTHYAVHDYGDYPRFLYRVTLEGDIPQ